VDGVVRGDLFVIGGGDPVLMTPEYAGRYEAQPQIWNDVTALADRIASSGIRRVEGSIVGDETRYDADRYLDSWPQRYLDQHSIGPVSALSVNDGFERFPTRDDPSVVLVPAADPAAHAASVISALLQARGVVVTGPPRSGVAPPTGNGVTDLTTLESLTVRDLVAELLRFSDTDSGEMLLKELGVRAGAGGSYAAGAAALAERLTDGGIALDGAVVADGSGLALDNRVTCALLAELLGRAETGDVLVDGLAVAGESGTLRNRFRGSPLQGRLRAKTGTLRSVSSLAGVVPTRHGTPLFFAYVLNLGDRAVASADVAHQDQLATILHEHPRNVDVASLGPE
jgi:D-alanyl-D-alanine carboxypeptidase/D-alanyl-D-alanine-endopeptidase (penicillin-binding protein 4)